MKLLIAALLCSTFALTAFAGTRKFECVRTSEAEILLPPPSHRIIFVADKAKVAITDGKVAVNLIGKMGWNFELPIKSQSPTKLSAKDKHRVFPSGDPVKSYVIEDSVKMSDLDIAVSKLVVKSVEKYFLRGEDLRYYGEYDCQELIKF